MNPDRVESAKDMIELADDRVRATMEVYHDTHPDEWTDFVTDVLADLRHFCAAHAINFDERDERSEEHFNTEQKGRLT